MVSCSGEIIDFETRIESFSKFINELATPIGNLGRRDSVVSDIALADNPRGLLSRETLK
jgi:hypothetical protein